MTYHIALLQACKRGGMKEIYVLNEKSGNKPDKPKPMIKRDLLLSTKDKDDIKRWTRLSGIFDTSKVDSFNKNMIQQIIRLVLFETPLSRTNKDLLKRDIDNQVRSFLRKTEFFTNLSTKDQSLVRNVNFQILVIAIHLNLRLRN